MWRELIEDLLAAGWTEAKIAERVGVKQPTINRLKKGVQTKTSYETGEALMALRGKVATADRRATDQPT